MMRFSLRIAAASYFIFVLFMVLMVTVDENFSLRDQRYSESDVISVKRKNEKEYPNVSLERWKHDITVPGANGSGLSFNWSSFNDDERKTIDTFYEEHGYNGYLSDLVPLYRNVKDHRPQMCKDIKYPSYLPEISIVIPFRNEVLSVLLRTVYSILANTPAKLLKEVILVDDGSDIVNLKTILDIHISGLRKVSVLRMNTTVGLMMARQAGIDKTSAEFFACMDSHMEVTEGWLEPLLSRLLENSKALLCSRMGVINKDNFGVWWTNFDKPTYFPFFSWNLEQTMAVYRPEFLARIKSLTDPVPYPTIQGMMIVMKKDWFLQLGGFDPGMRLWGTEQMELSVKVWTCGGVVEMIPCSNVAHLYRTKVVWSFKDEGKINKIRFAEVWMDEYKAIFNRYHTLNVLMAGDVEDRKRIRRENECKPFQYYVDEMQKIAYIYTAKNLLHFGMLYNEQFEMCLDASKFQSNQPGLSECISWYNQMFELSAASELHQFNNILVQGPNGNVIIKNWIEMDEATRTTWDYINQTLVHSPTAKCLCGHQDGKVTLEHCNSDKNQMWIWKELKVS